MQRKWGHWIGKVLAQGVGWPRTSLRAGEQRVCMAIILLSALSKNGEGLGVWGEGRGWMVASPGIPLKGSVHRTW
jgi:hypothetical protein